MSGTFRSDEQRKNPDMLEHDHATLLVNRPDDAFAKKRFDSDDPDLAKMQAAVGYLLDRAAW